MKSLRDLTVLSAAALLGLIFAGCRTNTIDSSQPLRLAWQPPWANQGQVVEVLKHSGVSERHRVKLDYRGFTYGGPMTEAALAHQVDLLLLGDQPAATLISRDDTWEIIARMVNYRSAIIVPIDSPVKTLKDLSGKKVAAAFGSTTHRDAVRVFEEAGMQVGRDVEFVSLDQAEHAAVIARGGKDSWGGIAAIATYDPTVAVATLGNQARILSEWVSPGVVVTNKGVIRDRAAQLQNFLEAYREAYAIYAANPKKFDTLYETDSRLPLPDEAYRMMAAVEPNLQAKDISSVNILIDAAQITMYQRNADLALKIGILKTPVSISRQVDLSITKSAAQAVK